MIDWLIKDLKMKKRIDSSDLRLWSKLVFLNNDVRLRLLLAYSREIWFHYSKKTVVNHSVAVAMLVLGRNSQASLDLFRREDPRGRRP